MSVGVTAVVVAYNGGSLLGDCIRALLASSYRGLDVVVVDNASSDGSVEALRASSDARVRFLGLPRNLGFAAGVNAGISFARSDGSSDRAAIYALVNQDCIVRPGWLEPLVEVLVVDPEVAVAGARLYEPDDRTLQHAGGVILANGMTEHLGRGSTDPDAFREPRDVDYVTAALCAFREDVWERFGPFDEGFRPVYYEEADFCVRCRRAGLRTLYVPASEAVHFEASSSERGSAVYLHRYHRSRMRFAVRHLLCAGSAGAALRAELAWLGRQRTLAQIVPALRAYLRVPGELVGQRWLRRAVTERR